MRRQWRSLEKAHRGAVIRVLQFNILAESLAEGSSEEVVRPTVPAGHFAAPGSAGCHYHSRLVHSCHTFRTLRSHLDWETRKARIVDILLQAQADLICLQEVDNFGELKAALEGAGYEGLFCKKAWKKIRDGSAVFWLRERSLATRANVSIGVTWASGSFRLSHVKRQTCRRLAVAPFNFWVLKSRNVLVAQRNTTGHPDFRVLWQVRMSLEHSECFQILPSSAMTALLLRFSLATGERVVVCATHLKAGFSAEMEATALEKRLRHFAGREATILAADLNAHYAPYALCTPSACCDPEPSARVEPKTVTALLEAGFRSAYGFGEAVASFPSFTAWSGWLDRDVKADLDYILLRGPVVPLAFLEGPEEAAVLQWPELLPNRCWPSDHIHLLADLELL
ncbi:unnamed protein product [Effrenium voratum]|uniref:Endonuclease/exonuclease/phosphatase domain-containing protein n=1 Tax=Effrenium voratum TaxID=2562239 RepID=A0AA36MXS1_9DINO|nr:unnamed protein product [Effrenium voratum]